ncbi:MAG: ABC transporter substrate-binding protein [Parasporobacterium sp.]|nr:ABC transporter substrate-binding protein [Parasporobacterium sp.]
MKKVITFWLVIAIVMAAALSVYGGTSENGEASNSVVVGISQDIDSLDPHNADYAGTREVLFNLFEGLVKATSGGSIEPAVAESYEISEDAQTITFKLRTGITFHDGTPVTPEDIKYSIERYAGIQGEGSSFDAFKELQIIDDQTVAIILSEPNPEFIYELTCAVIPQANDADVNSNPIGTGPFKYVSFTPGMSIVLEKYEGYWKEGYPFLDEVTFKVVTDVNTAIFELNAGSLDIYQYLTADQVTALNENLDILEGSVNYVQALFLNNAVAPFDNVLVRQAMYYAVDRDLVNEFVFGGKSHIIGTNMIPAAEAYYNADTETTYTHDVQKAKELLAEAGYPDGFEFTITVPNNYAPHESTAQILAESLAEVGIKANINLVEFTTWFSDVYTDRNYEATVVAVDGKSAPSSWFTKNISTAANNFTNYSNPQYDEVFNLAFSATDLDRKAEYYKQLQQILADDAASIYVQDPANLLAINNKLEGYVFYPVSAQDMSVVKYKD